MRMGHTRHKKSRLAEDQTKRKTQNEKSEHDATHSRCGTYQAIVEKMSSAIPRAIATKLFMARLLSTGKFRIARIKGDFRVRRAKGSWKLN